MRKTTLLIAALAATVMTGCQAPSGSSTALPKQELPEFLVTTLGTAPGWVVADTEGFYCHVFQYAGTGDYVDKFNGAISAIKEEGKKGGSNALVNLQISSESHEIQGSRWHASIVHLCGDFVTLK